VPSYAYVLVSSVRKSRWSSVSVALVMPKFSLQELVKQRENSTGSKIPTDYLKLLSVVTFLWVIKCCYSVYRAKYGITEMCRDQWNWASKNPYGYASPDSTKQNGSSNSH
jgi:hypothetical protein